MKRDIVTISPGETMMGLHDKLKQYKISGLPVVENEQLIGMIRETDFINIASHLLYEKLAESE